MTSKVYNALSHRSTSGLMSAAIFSAKATILWAKLGLFRTELQLTFRLNEGCVCLFACPQHFPIEQIEFALVVMLSGEVNYF